jgi:predicted Zn-ribbon and HTH transcriptional regulator
MFRKDLIDMLHDRPMSVVEIATLLEEPPKRIEDDLRHLLKSLKHMDYHAHIIPACCNKCGFKFNKDKLTKPGKCPRCKGTWIDEPRIEIIRSH